jgi:hypothetical protein
MPEIADDRRDRIDREWQLAGTAHFACVQDPVVAEGQRRALLHPVPLSLAASPDLKSSASERAISY